jgi:hypothetical protein
MTAFTAITFVCVVKSFANVLLFHSPVLFRTQQVARIFALPNAPKKQVTDRA